MRRMRGLEESGARGRPVWLNGAGERSAPQFICADDFRQNHSSDVQPLWGAGVIGAKGDALVSRKREERFGAVVKELMESAQNTIGGRVVVRENGSACDQSRPEPSQGIDGALIEVQIEMHEAEAEIVETLGAGRKQAGMKFYPAIPRAEVTANNGKRAAPFSFGEPAFGIWKTLEGVEEMNALGGCGKHDACSSAKIYSGLGHVASELVARLRRLKDFRAFKRRGGGSDRSGYGSDSVPFFAAQRMLVSGKSVACTAYATVDRNLNGFKERGTTLIALIRHGCYLSSHRAILAGPEVKGR